jgi:hypothetical protein
MNQFIQNWFSKIIDSPKAINYRIFIFMYYVL